MNITPRYAVVIVLMLLLACGGGQAARPTRPPEPTATPAPSATPAAPTPSPTAGEALVQLARGAAQPTTREGPWSAQQQNLGEGPEVQVTMPLNLDGSNEQIVRLNQTRIAGVVKAVFDAYPDVGRVNVIGTSPVGEQETPGISIVVTRAEYAAWSGRPAELPGWQVGERFR